MLKGQGYQMDSIPKNDEIIYLRENSNISTGGDSIDVTDQIPDDYKKIAVDAVSALGAKISGIDLIIENTEVPAANKNAYGIIEANFNPSMYMHIYPYKGKSRRLTMDIIHYLFPELLQRSVKLRVPLAKCGFNVKLLSDNKVIYCSNLKYA